MKPCMRIFSVFPERILIRPRNTRLSLESETFKLVADLIKTVLRYSKASGMQTFGLTKECLRSDSPPYDIHRLDSPPLFPRDHSSRRDVRESAKEAKKGILDVRSMSDLRGILPGHLAQIEEEERDIYREHMVVVNGWSTFIYCPRGFCF